MIDEFFLSPAILGLFGLCIGSFLNVVIHRLPLMLQRQWLSDAAAEVSDADGLHKIVQLPAVEAEAIAAQARDLSGRLERLPKLSLASPRSQCPCCGHQLAWHENLPLLSWLRLGGRCSSCEVRISIRYPMVELLTAGLFAALSWRFGPTPLTLLWCGFAACLVALAAIDWDSTLLPDCLTQPLLWAGLCAALLGLTIPLTNAVSGALAGYLSLWSVYCLFKLATGKEGMGYGDFKLLAALGAWLGWQMLLPIVLAASMLGAAVGIGMMVLRQHDRNVPIPFGPFLSLAGLLVLFAGQPRVLGWLGWGG
jgi:leader peptidase (prepilin peptidase)/N-methyltransferase